MKDNSPTRSINRSFHKSQIGYISECLEPVSSEWTIGDAIAMLPESISVKSIPVEENGGVVGLAPVDVMSSKNRSLWESLKNNTVGKCMTRNALIIDARENVERALAIILKKNRENTFDDYLVFHNGKYFGVGSFLKLTEQITLLRSMDLEKARFLQEMLIDNRKYCGKNMEIKSYIKMANDLGGDFFQAMQITESQSVLACFDVSGKNVSAALTTSMLGAFFSTVFLGNFMKNKTPEDFVRFLNDVCRDQTPGETYVTGVLLFSDFEKNQVEIFNCGYTQVFYFSADGDGKRSCKILNPNFIPLGLDELPDLEKNARVVPITKGMRFFLYSDGLIDARNNFGSMYGDEGLKQFLLSTHKLSLEELMTAFENEITDFIGGAVLADDITAFAVQYV